MFRIRKVFMRIRIQDPKNVHMDLDPDPLIFYLDPDPIGVKIKENNLYKQNFWVRIGQKSGSNPILKNQDPVKKTS